MRAFPTLIAAIGLAAASIPAQAFDTGHHQDATMNSLRKAGFKKGGAEIAFVANWLVDFYAATGVGDTQMDQASEALHFDNLFTTAEVDAYWKHLEANFNTAVQKVVSNTKFSNKDKEIRCLILIGITLHAIQDFYTHSNWTDLVTPSGDGYATATYLTLGAVPSNAAATGSSALQTGYYPDSFKVGYAGNLNSSGTLITLPSTHQDHGTYFTGLNKDSHIRPDWDKAYVFASLETRRFLTLAESLIEAAQSGLWAKMQGLGKSDLSSTDQGDLEDDLRNSYKISMFVDGTNNTIDGHYKGNLSGAASETIGSGFGYIVADIDSFIVDIFQDEHIMSDLTSCLYGGSGCVTPSSAYAVPAGVLPHAVILSVPYVKASNSTIDTLSQADFYTEIQINNSFPALDRVLDDMDTYDSSSSSVQINNQPTDAWTQLYLVDSNQMVTCGSAQCVTLQLALFDFDTPDPDDPIDISSDGKTLNIEYRLSDGLVNANGISQGNYNTRDTAVSSSGGSGDRAQIKFYVYDKALLVP